MHVATSAPTKWLRGMVDGAAALIGLLFLAIPFAPVWRGVRLGLNDFSMLYVAPHLIAARGLYDAPAFLAKEAQLLGVTNHNVLFTRLPFMAVLLAPLSALPYPAAYAIWQAASLAALIAFVFLWPAKRPLAFVICCWFPPLAANFANGQDVSFLLLWIALGARLCTQRKDFAGGLVMSLCLAKPHLFLFLPVFVLARRMWRFGAGLVAGSAALLGISFVAAGPGWPLAFLETIRNPAVHPDITRSSLVAFAGTILNGTPLALFVAALIAALAAAVYVFSRRLSFIEGLAITAAVGPLAAFHVYLQDYSLALPLLLILVTKAVENRAAEDRAAISSQPH